MIRFSSFLAFAVLAVSGVWFAPNTASAECRIVDGTPQSKTYAQGDLKDDICDTHGQKPITVEEVNVQAGGEHIGVTEAEGYQIVRGNLLSSGQKTADAQIKASPGYVSHMTCQGSDAAAVAGTIILYDATTETGTAVFTFTVAALDYHNPVVFPIMVDFASGIYLGYTTTSDMACTVFYR